VKPALVLIDLQYDFLFSRGLQPPPGEVVARVAELLDACRHAAVPVIHVWTSVRRDPDERMPHWRASGRWLCEEGTPGHQPPDQLRPIDNECIIHKQGFSPFVTSDLEMTLRAQAVDTLLLAGVHLHGCIRATALDAYQRGLSVWIVAEGVASNDALHAEVSIRYLNARGIRLVSSAEVLHEIDGGERARSLAVVELPSAIIDGRAHCAAGPVSGIHTAPRQRTEQLWTLRDAGPAEVSATTAAAERAQWAWRGIGRDKRLDLLAGWRNRLAAERAFIVHQLAIEVGKPLRDGEAEVDFALALIDAHLERGAACRLNESGAGWAHCRRPLGVVAIITPFNNPLGIPVGKIAPAVVHGNAVVWKPAPAGSGVALALHRLLLEAGWPPGLVNVICGGSITARLLMSDPHVNAVSITGSPAAGLSAQVTCARRTIPLQAELGGNNAAIVWKDANLTAAAAAIAAGAFGCAGQRCTANRRAVVAEAIYDSFVENLERATAALAWGDPLDATTQVGPLISDAARVRAAAAVARAQGAGCVIRAPHAGGAQERSLIARGAYLAPTIVECHDPEAELVQEETFGPVLVLQRAADWAQAIARCNGVRHALVAALFSSDPHVQESFLEEAQAGVLKLNSSTAGVAADAPFGGWGISGIGPPEHGGGDEAFYTRGQTLYCPSAPDSRDK
jgi:alpha-ketoglutaric semialdehyde dehydrogenase